MSTANLDAFAPGLVVYLDYDWLSQQPESDAPANHKFFNSTPFLLVQADDSRSVWTCLTSRGRPERLLIQPHWKTGKHRRWHEFDTFLGDGLTTIVVTNEDACKAIERGGHTLAWSASMRGITEDGINAVLNEIRTQGGALLDTPPKQPRVRLAGAVQAKVPSSPAAAAAPAPAPAPAAAPAVAISFRTTLTKPRTAVPPAASSKPSALSQAQSVAEEVNRILRLYAEHDDSCPARAEPDHLRHPMVCRCGLSSSVEKVLKLIERPVANPAQLS